MKKILTIILALIALTTYSQNIKTYRLSDETMVSKTLSEVNVVAESKIKFTDTVGPYNQPYWTKFRKSPTSRVYVSALPGTVSYEHWNEYRTFKDKSEMRTREELTFGLGKRLQLDLYLLGLKKFDGYNGSFDLRGTSIEMRYALADWGKIWGNPTIYFEYIFLNNNYNVIEPKLLLGDVFGPNHNNMWCVNFVYEGNIAPANIREKEVQVTASYHHMFNNIVSVGSAFQYVKNLEPGSNEYDCLLGPSLQLTLSKNAFLDIEPLFGLYDSHKTGKMYFVFGWEF